MAIAGRGLAGLVAALALLGVARSGAADEEERLRRVSFRVESSREVENDLLVATLAATDEDADPAALAERINQTMAWALGVARAEKRVRAESGGYQTHPVYDRTRIRGWRATQHLRIESGDFGAATALLGRLQGRLQLESLEFSVSPKLARELEDELIVEALAGFRARAERVTKSLGASRFEIVELAIDTQGGAPPPQPVFRAAMAAEAAAVPVAAEGGSTRVGVQVHATIELD